MKKRLKRAFLIMAIITLTFLVGLYFYKGVQHSKITKSPQDNRSYHALTLPNQLKVIVVSDPEAHTAAAHMVVRKGSFDEPQDMPGLAHFCEHMLFLGTQKYPEPDTFRNFIQSHGGETNAMTKNESTEYFFNVRPDALPQAIEQFADFFVAPLFEKSLVEREINAVDSEFQMHLNEDGWGIMDVSKETANPAHPFSRFSIGNHETLSQDKNKLYKDVVEFYRKNYQPKDMTLVIVGPQSVNELSGLAKKHFHAITGHSDKNKKDTAVTSTSYKDIPIYDKAQLGTDLYIKSKGDFRELVLTFPIKNQSTHALKVAGNVLGHILGYEGKGGLALYLKQKHWISFLQAQLDTLTETQNSITLSFILTPEGLNHIEDITSCTYGFISLVKNQGLPSYYFNELKQISYNSFIYNEKSSPQALASFLVGGAHLYPDQQLLTHHFFMPKDQFPQNEFDSILKSLTPDNMRRIIVGNNVTEAKQSRWFKMPYRLAPFTEKQVNTWINAPAMPEFTLPAKNEYIPENMALKKPPAYICNTPKRIERDNIILWHHQDAIFKIPKADVRINLISSQEPSPESHVLAMIYANGMLEQLNAHLYPANEAGTSILFDMHSRGLSLYFSGYNDKQDRLIVEVLKKARDYQMDEKLFNLIKERVINSINNSRQVPLYSQAFAELSNIIYHPSWHPDELIAASESITLSKVNAYIKHHWQDIKAEALISGNYTEKDANELAMVIASQLPKSEANIDVKRKTKVVSLPKGSLIHHYLPTEDPNHIGVWYVQNRKNDDATLAKTLLLSKFLEGPFFQKLRVEKQLGYALNVHPYVLNKTSGFLFWVQSPQVLPNQLINEMQQFVKQFQKDFSSLSEQELALHKESLLHELNQPPMTLGEQTERWWNTIETGEYEFDRRQKLKEAVEKITINDLQVFSRTALSAPTDSGQIFVTTHHEPTESMGSEIGSIQEFKSQSDYFTS